MWVVQVDLLHHLFSWHFETPSPSVSFFKRSVKPIFFIISTWRWVKLLLYDLPCALSLTSICHRLEDTGCCWLAFLNRFRVVVADTWVRLLKVNVYSDRFYKVKWILLVKWQTKVTFWIKFGAADVLFNGLWVVLARTDLEIRVDHLHFSCHLKPISLAYETIEHSFLAKVF